MTMLDTHIRAALHDHLDATLPAGSVVIDEYGGGGGGSVIDVAAFTVTGLHLFEIKSDGDSCTRLAQQVVGYGYCSTTATLVVGPQLLRKAWPLIPRWWGVMLAQPRAAGGVLLEQQAHPQPNPEETPERVAGPLWSSETWDHLKARGLSKGNSKLTSAGRQRLLAEHTPLPELRALVLDTIKSRGWRGNEPDGREARHPVRVIAGRAA